jgi:hypothetical protein
MINYYFINEEHERNFNELMARYKLKRLQDFQFEPVIYIAALPEIFRLFTNLDKIDYTISPLIHLSEFDEKEEKRFYTHPGLTGTTMRMCSFGQSLYNGDPVDLDEVLGAVVQRELTDVLIQAFKIRAKNVYYLQPR